MARPRTIRTDADDWSEHESRIRALEATDYWHLVGATGEIAFQNSWVNFGSTNDTAGYRVLPGNAIAFKGCVKSGSLATAMFTMPIELRPALRKSAACAIFDAGVHYHGMILFFPNGDFRVDAGAGPVNPIDECWITSVFAL